MIKFSEQVPSVYINASRDFQYLSWLINIVLNSVKHNVDDLYDLPNTKADAKLTELLAMTLGFKIKRNYDKDQLAALVAVLPKILKYKGTMTAVEIAGKALIAAAGASGGFSAEIKDCELSVVLPEKLVDISLFTDLLPYILPAGMTSRVIKTNRILKTIPTKLDYEDRMIADWIPDIAFSENGNVGGLASLYDTTSTAAVTFANYDKNLNLNAGLMDNTVIPVVETYVGQTYDEPETPNE